MPIDWTTITAIITVAATVMSTIYTNHKNNKSSYSLKEMEISSNLKLKAFERLNLKYEILSKEYYNNSEIREKLLHLNAKLTNGSLNDYEAREFVIYSIKLSENTDKLSIFLDEEEYKSYKESRKILEYQDGSDTKKILNISYLISALIENKLREFNNNIT